MCWSTRSALRLPTVPALVGSLPWIALLLWDVFRCERGLLSAHVLYEAHGCPRWSFALISCWRITMSPKQRRKYRGARRLNQRVRDWTRWYREGLIDAESRGSLRLRMLLAIGT